MMAWRGHDGKCRSMSGSDKKRRDLTASTSQTRPRIIFGSHSVQTTRRGTEAWAIVLPEADKDMA
jgi:hypothetical protein